MIQEKDFLYRVPVKNALVTTPNQQVRNPEILVDLEGGEFMHGNILDANSTNKLINQSVKDAVDNKLIESGYVTQDLLNAETTRATEQENSLKTLIGAETSARTKGDESLSAKIKAEQTRAEGKEKEISDKLAIVDGDSNTEGSFRKAIADVIAAAPEDLDTLKEIADKLADNDDLHTVLNQAITDKADASALLNEVTRATAAESNLQAAIDTKADATALSNYVLTAALNKQVDTLNTAISAKQDAGNYIPYDASDDSYYKIDKPLKISASGLTGIIHAGLINLCSDGGPGNIKMDPINGVVKTGRGDDFQLNGSGLTCTDIIPGQKNSKFSINPDQVLLQKDDNNLVKISSAEMLLQKDDNNLVKASPDGVQFKKDGSDFIDIKQNNLNYTTGTGNIFVGATGSGFRLQLTDESNHNYAVVSGYEIYVKGGVALDSNGIVANPGQSSQTYIYNKAESTLAAAKIIGQHIDAYGDLRDGINKVEQKVTANTTALEGKQDKGNYVVCSSEDKKGYIIGKPIIVGDMDNKVRLEVGSMTAIRSSETTTYSVDGIRSSRHRNCLATSDGSFKPISDFLLKADEDIEYVGKTMFDDLTDNVQALMSEVNRKQDKITVNSVDVTNLETADITQLRAIVKDLLTALSSSGLIRQQLGLE